MQISIFEEEEEFKCKKRQDHNKRTNNQPTDHHHHHQQELNEKILHWLSLVPHDAVAIAGGGGFDGAPLDGDGPESSEQLLDADAGGLCRQAPDKHGGGGAGDERGRAEDAVPGAGAVGWAGPKSGGGGLTAEKNYG